MNLLLALARTQGRPLGITSGERTKGETANYRSYLPQVSGWPSSETMEA